MDVPSRDLAPASKLVAAASSLGSFTVLRSCSPGQVALEVESRQHGLFTCAFLDKLREVLRTGARLEFNESFGDAVAKTMKAIAAKENLTAMQTPDFAKSAGCAAQVTFTMGSPPDEEERIYNETQHRVVLTKGFWLGQYEVTQAQWRSVMGNNPSGYKGDRRPVESVSWDDCRKFIAKCNAAARGVRFALPTEAQWEYACRAGTTGPYAGSGDLDEMGWYDGNRGNGTHPVGRKRPNAWNLYDMHGNVWEWCVDWDGVYEGDCTDPTGPASGEDRVLRGGCWHVNARYCRSAFRFGNLPGFRYLSIGFRLFYSAGPHE